MSDKDGGPAFPIGYDTCSSLMGMTLRDYFAGQALVGIMASKYLKDDLDMNPFSGENINHGGVPLNDNGDRTPWDMVVSWVPQACYRIADGMLAAREAK